MKSQLEKAQAQLENGRGFFTATLNHLPRFKTMKMDSMRNQ
jgi:hypothetical protein